MDTLTERITEALRTRIFTATLDSRDVLLAEWLLQGGNNSLWIVMIAGAAPDVFETPNYYDALIEEVRAKME